MNKKQNIEKQIKYLYIIGFVLAVLFTAFLSFYRLDAKYIDPWDEARHGINAYEMANGGSMIQSTYLRQADYYNLKPPLSMYGIMIGYALFGNTVFGLRFYSAMAYVLLTILTGLFMKRYGKLQSIFSMLFLAINTTAFQAHMIRSGDADSLYVLLFSCAMLSMLLIGENVRMIYICGLCFSLAFLAKSYHAMIIAIIGAVYLILTGLIRKLGLKNWLCFLLASFGPILLWALLRMRIDGLTFFRQMWDTDVLGRTSGELKNNIAPFSYYFSFYFGNMTGKITVYLCALIICIVGMLLYFRPFTKEKMKIWLGFLLWAIVPFLVFSCVGNKLLWYVYPTLVPLLCVAGAFTGKFLSDQRMPKLIRAIALIGAVFMIGYFAKGEVDIIRTQSSNDFQMLVKETGKSALTIAQADQNIKTDTNGKENQNITKAYVDYDENQNMWQQQDVLAAELYGDFYCQNGGLSQLLEDYGLKARGKGTDSEAASSFETENGRPLAYWFTSVEAANRILQREEVIQKQGITLKEVMKSDDGEYASYEVIVE